MAGSSQSEKKPTKPTLIYCLCVANIYLDVQTGYQIAAYKKVANHSKIFQLNYYQLSSTDMLVQLKMKATK